MKKSLLLLTAVVTITACQSAQNPNANQNAAGNQNANKIAVVADEPSCDSQGVDQVVREIFIEAAAASGARINTDIDDISISVGHEKVIWCVTNTSDIQVNVIINNLRNVDNAGVRNPFGDQDDWKDNTFVSKIINPPNHGTPRVKNLRTKPAKKSGTYKYSILLMDHDGNLLDFVDPQVVISDGLPAAKPRNGNSGSRNTNAANKNNKQR